MTKSLLASLGSLVFASACFVESRCFDDADCAAGEVCDIAAGRSSGACRHRCDSDADCSPGTLCNVARGTCVEADCQTDDHCDPRFMCVAGRCISRELLHCPPGMVAVERQFCVDMYEASRPDATLAGPGADSTAATSRPGVLPWQVAGNAEAQAACEAAGKMLCSEMQWTMACQGSDRSVYSYANEYSPTLCNGIDKYCRCEESCADRDPCPFPHCYHLCGAGFRLDPTGNSPGCTNDYGVFDMNGNLWEHVAGGDDTRIRGGAFNCADSENLHRCDYIPAVWTPSARGFRCCSLGLAQLPSDGSAGDTDGASGDQAGDP